MSNRYFSTAKGPYIHCDICGQACYLWEVTKLSPDTGRGGLMVCRNDADKFDPGLKAYTITSEKRIPFSKPNNDSLANGAAPYDVETQGIF